LNTQKFGLNSQISQNGRVSRCALVFFFSAKKPVSRPASQRCGRQWYVWDGLRAETVTCVFVEGMLLWACFPCGVERVGRGGGGRFASWTRSNAHDASHATCATPPLPLAGTRIARPSDPERACLTPSRYIVCCSSRANTRPSFLWVVQASSGAVGARRYSSMMSPAERAAMERRVAARQAASGPGAMRQRLQASQLGVCSARTSGWAMGGGGPPRGGGVKKTASLDSRLLGAWPWWSGLGARPAPRCHSLVDKHAATHGSCDRAWGWGEVCVR
jgi:hypothetical protein